MVLHLGQFSVLNHIKINLFYTNSHEQLIELILIKNSPDQ